MLPLLVLGLVLSANGAVVKNFDNRIVGGRPTSIEEYPFQASLLFFDFPTCGGCIISPKFVITAAHCTNGVMEDALTVRVGSNVSTAHGEIIAVKKIHQNPLFNYSNMDFDISVLELENLIKFGPTAAPIKLVPNDFQISSGVDVTVTGWGTLKEEGELASELQVVQIPSISNEECQKAYGAEANITERMVCARQEGGGKDSCQGDSGGPMVVNGLLAGIVSWGFGCARAEYPGVYTRVSALRDFIKSVTNI